jgi:tight adherence protein C
MTTEDIYVLVLTIFWVVAVFIFLFEKWMGRRIIGRKIADVLATKQLSSKQSIIKRFGTSILAALMNVSAAISLPDQSWNKQKLLLQFLRAGLYADSTFQFYFSIKGLLTIGLSAVMVILLLIFTSTVDLTTIALYGLMAAVIGYYLPDWYLKYRIGYRKGKNQDVLADFVDLLVICVEAGMGLDAALNKIQIELAYTNACFSKELHITNLEIRAGSGRNVALRNFALRVDLDDLRNLVTMLVQVEQFGTSVANSLRIHSDVMRITRMQRAEKIAARIPVNMLIPMVLCIFPGFLAVILGPAGIQLMNVFKTID